ncbi:hypothetical protein P692DRAFT_20822219 [Suillus brevipes Sb2]|nr:hypothetical protein P692DRAFT_20822219 [Suillus brevipes Sb2]
MMVCLVCGSVVAHGDSFGELQQTILDYNVASAIIFSATRFQPLVAMNFLLALAEQVILMIREDAHGVHNLLVTQFSRAHTQIQPWGILVPGQWTSLPNLIIAKVL